MFAVRSWLAVGVAASLAGCTTLPTSGPTAGQIEHANAPGTGQLVFKIIDLASPSPDVAAALEAKAPEPGLAALDGAGRNDLIGPGDRLTITVYEVGTRLFGGKSDSVNPLDTTAQGQTLGEFTVQPDGSVSLPYAGQVYVGESTVQDVQRVIVSRLARMSQFPQAVVTVKQNVTNTVFVTGEIAKAGRYDLTNSNERLLDIVAEAGGARTQPYDTIVSLTRGDRTVRQRLSEITPESANNLVLHPSDRISLIRQPLSYTVLGATEKVALVPFDSEQVSLVEAVARAGGPAENYADPSAVYLFRFEPRATPATTASAVHESAAVGPTDAAMIHADGTAVPAQPAAMQEQPTVYRLNLLQPASYLVAQKFMVRDKDVIYFATARANQPGKLAQIISQIFTPIFMARQMTR